MIAGFEFGCRAPLVTRRESIGQDVGGDQAWRLLYASDLHLTRRRQDLAAQIVSVVAHERPHAVLLGGDLIDRRNGIPVLQHMVQSLEAVSPVVAISGNNDVARVACCNTNS